MDPLKVEGSTGCHDIVLRPCLFFASCQSEFNFESNLGLPGPWGVLCGFLRSEISAQHLVLHQIQLCRTGTCVSTNVAVVTKS